MRFPHPPPRLVVAVLLLVQALMLAHAAWTDSVVIDESGHLASGLAHWKSGDFRPYDVNPPLLRTIGTAPLLLLRPAVPTIEARRDPYFRPEFTLADAFSKANSRDYIRLVRAARWLPIALTLATSLLLYDLGCELHGEAGGLLSLGLWVFCPTALAHGHYLTVDVGAAGAGLLAYRSYRQSIRGGIVEALAFGMSLGLALLAKFTLVVLIPLWATAWLVRNIAAGARPRMDALGRLALIAAPCILVVQAGYNFDRPVTRLGDFEFISRALSGKSEPPAGDNRFRGTRVGSVPVPLPAEWVLGIDRQRRDLEIGMRSYLRGEHRPHGWWYYYLYCLLVKLPVPHLALLAAGLLATLAGSRGRPAAWSVWLPGLAILGLVSSQTGFSHHLRYCLPALPFFYLGAGRLASLAAERKWLAIVILASLAVSASSVVANHPHHLAYFNELAGGPSAGHLHLLDSNLDWGQDLLRLRDWLARHPEAGVVHLAAYHVVDPGTLGIIYLSVHPAGGRPVPGWYVFSANVLFGYDAPVFTPDGSSSLSVKDEFREFRKLQCAARIGRSLWVYRIE